MITVTKQYRTETGHRLSNYDGKCSHMHGHSYLWEVTATAPALTDNGMIVDFKYLKAAMVQVLEPLDHALVLCADDPLVQTAGQDLRALLNATNGQPPRLFVWRDNPTAEHFARWAADSVQGELDMHDADIKVTRVRVWETVNSFAEWNHVD